MKKAAIVFFSVLLVYFVGPTPDTPTYHAELPTMPDIENLETYLHNAEAEQDIKPGNEAQIVWHEPSSKSQTEVAILYLHGFTASREEGNPTHRTIAKTFGCNLYLARLSEHGLITDEPLLNYTAEAAWQSAKDAYAIAKKLGKEVVILSTSTGGTLALKLAATYPEVKALVNYSPNIEINDPSAFLLNDPWGLQIARLYFGGDYRTLKADAEYKKYWYAKYRLESVVQLQELVETAATAETFRKVTCPVFNGVYYKDAENQDPTVRVEAIRRMHQTLGTSEQKKQLVEFPEAGGHVIAYGKQSGAIEAVIHATESFLESVVGLPKLPSHTSVSKTSGQKS